MNLSSEQSIAMERIMKWHGDPKNWLFYLGGFAGTGKTTLLQEIINRLETPPTCLAPTGKAASVLAKKLNNAMVTTIHSALYKPVMPNTSELEALEAKLVSKPGTKELIEAIREEKRKLAAKPVTFMDNPEREIQPGDLVMVDEASMVTKKMVEDLRMTKAHVLFVGDPGQLPPVKDSGYFTTARPDAMLETIHRQALGNPIIELSMRVRMGDSIPKTIENEHITKRCKTGFEITKLSEADQVLTGKNLVRHRLNRAVRRVRGFEGTFPREGEKLICLKNKHTRGAWIVNGMQCLSASACDMDNTGSYRMDVLYEGLLLQGLDCYHHPFEVHYKTDSEEDPWSARSQLAEFDYGYAITVHKSQGSEWERVILVDDELFARDIRTRRRWLYTAVTRAKEHLTWLTQD